jgi:hypothetical protein
MLKKISCDKFISNGKIREPIVFHPGLNTVLGTASGANSIGKSTFLMIIDFVFGGDDYVGKMRDVEANVGSHIICFEFEFNGNPFYYSRSTSEPRIVNVCDKDYQVVERITLDQYRALIANKYGLNTSNITFRDAVGPFFRIYHRDTTNEEYPLRADSQEGGEKAIKRLLKLYSSYSSIEEEEKNKKAAHDEEDAMKKATSYEQIRAAKNKSEYEANKKRIEALLIEQKELAEKSDKGLLEITSFQAERLSMISAALSSLRKQRTRLKTQITAISQDKDESKKSIKHDYEELQVFFNEVNIAKLSEIEAFHEKLGTILKKEYKEALNELETMLEITEQQIESLEIQQASIANTPNVSKAILDRYAETTREIENLTKANSNYEKTKSLKEASGVADEKYDSVIKTETEKVQDLLNVEMKKINDVIYQGEKTSPTIQIENYKKYLFFTPNDGGTGTQCRGLIIFDLALLKGTKVPTIVHDSIVLKNIEDNALEKIIEAYMQNEKQVFIAFDRDVTYSDEMRRNLQKTKVLQLSPNGNELFGRSWNSTK